MCLPYVGEGKTKMLHRWHTAKKWQREELQFQTRIISAEKPHLACSPDDLVEDDSVNNKLGTVEYKCPYSARGI
jgi:hypothetical protein